MSGPPVWVRVSACLSVAALAIPGLALCVETRLPANRTYLTFIQGLTEDSLEGEFDCVQFSPEGTFQVGGLAGAWWIDEELTHDARAVRLRVEPEDDDPRALRIDGLCWLDGFGSRHTLACAAHGFIPREVDGATFLGFGNFGWVGRPMNGALRPETFARCRTLTSRLNGALASR